MPRPQLPVCFGFTIGNDELSIKDVSPAIKDIIELIMWKKRANFKNNHQLDANILDGLKSTFEINRSKQLTLKLRHWIK